MPIEPPTDSAYGFVVCQIIRRVADATDSDDFPDAVAASGRVLFKPQVQVSKVSAPSAFAVRETVTVTLDDQGRITSPGNASLFGVWLLAGVYSVTFQLDNATLPSLTIEVTTDHTPAAPLDLVTAGSYTPPTGVTVQTLIIPSTVTTGQVLMLDDTRTLVGVPLAELDVNAAAGVKAALDGAVAAETEATAQAGIATAAASNAKDSETKAAASAAAASGAAASEAAAKTSETNAALSATDAATSATTATTQAGIASSAATAAAASASNAATSESQAAASAGVAQAAEVRAEQIVADLEGWEPGGGGASSWTEITGKPSVIAAGESAVEARAVIGAVSVEDLPDVSGFATTTALTSGLAGKQDAGDYATRAELPDVSGLATTAYVDQTVGDIDTVLSGILGGE